MTSVFSTHTNPIPRQWGTLAASLLLHGGVAAVLIAAAGATAAVVATHEDTELTFVQVVPVPVQAPVRIPPPRERIKFVEPDPIPEPVRQPEVVVARAEITPPAPEPAPRREEPVAMERPKVPAVVNVGSFGASGTSVRAETARPVQQAGFDTAGTREPEVKIAGPAVGAFDQSAGPGRVQAGTGKVGVGGFGTQSGTGPARSTGRVVDGGFGSGSGGNGKGTQPQGGVKMTAFDERAEQAAPAAVRQARTETPLEILSKPTPAYTDEARALKIEGEVAVAIEFAATGEIRVLKVVRGLGHGLDESAVRAVQGMRFKPAHRGGEPVDVRTIVNIVFRLA